MVPLLPPPRQTIFQWTCERCPFVVKGQTAAGVIAKAKRHPHHPEYLIGRVLLPGQDF